MNHYIVIIIHTLVEQKLCMIFIYVHKSIGCYFLHLFHLKINILDGWIYICMYKYGYILRYTTLHPFYNIHNNNAILITRIIFPLSSKISLIQR